jgi:hypothetical protein
MTCSHTYIKQNKVTKGVTRKRKSNKDKQYNVRNKKRQIKTQICNLYRIQQRYKVSLLFLKANTHTNNNKEHWNKIRNKKYHTVWAVPKSKKEAKSILLTGYWIEGTLSMALSGYNTHSLTMNYSGQGLIHGELVFRSGNDAPTLFRNLHKRC